MSRQKSKIGISLLATAVLSVLILPLSAFALTLPSVAEAASFNPASVALCTTTCAIADASTTGNSNSGGTTNISSSSSSTMFAPNPIPSDTNVATSSPDGVSDDPISDTSNTVVDDFVNSLGSFVATMTQPQSLYVDATDNAEIQQLDLAYQAIINESAGLGTTTTSTPTTSTAAYKESGNLLADIYNAWVKPEVAKAAGSNQTLYQEFLTAKDPSDLYDSNVLKVMGTTAAPTISATTLEALKYLTTPVDSGGAGIDWLHVQTISKGFTNDATAFNKDDPNLKTDGKTTSPCHYGRCIVADQIGKLKGTTFTYEVDVPQDQASQTLDPSTVDYSQARIVNKQQAADIPIKVIWQTSASSGSAPNFLGGSMQSIFSNIGLSQLTQTLTNGGSNCISSAGTLLAQSALTVDRTLGSGCLASQDSSSTANFNSPSIFVNAATSGASLIAQALSGGALNTVSSSAASNATSSTSTGIPANAIGAGDPKLGTTPQYVMGAALLGNALNNPNVFVNNPQSLSQSSQLLTAFGQTIMQKELTGWTGRNEFANLNATDSNGINKALGLAWLENFSNLGDSSSPLPLGQGQTMAQFATAYPAAFTRLFGDSATENGLGMPGANSQADFAKLAAAGSSSSQSLDGLLADIGSDILKNMTSSVTTLDSGFALTVGESSSDATGNARWNRMVAGDTNVWKEIGATRIAQVATLDISQQDALYSVLVGQGDSTVIDWSGINSKLGLQSGDFQSVFLNGQGWGVLQRLGLVQYAATLGGQSQALSNQAGASYSASTIVSQLTNIASQGNALVSAIKNSSPSQIVGSAASTLSSLLSGLNQNYYSNIGNSISSNSTVNPADSTIRAIQGSLGLLAASGALSSSSMSQAVAMNNSLSQIYSPNVSITNFSSWTGSGVSNIGSVMSATNLVSAFVGGQTGSQAMNWVKTAVGLEQLYNVAFGSASSQTTFPSGMNSASAFISTAQQALSAAGYSTNLFNASSVLINPTKQSVFNFVTNQLTAGTPAAGWASEMNAAFNLATGAQLTPQMMTGLLTGTSMKALTMLGAKDITTGLGLSAAMPFMSVLTGQNSFETAAKTATTQLALQSLYGLGSTQFTSSPTVNQALGMVMAGAIGVATDSLTSGKAFLSQNQPGAIAEALGLIPADVKAKQFIDPVAYANYANKIGVAVQANPSAYMAQINANTNLPSGFGDFLAGNITGDQLTEKYAISIDSTFVNNDPTSQADKFMNDLYGGDTSGQNYQKAYVLAQQMMDKLSLGSDGKPKDEAGALQIGNQIATYKYADTLGGGSIMLDPRVAQMTGSLINLGISNIDAQIQSLTGIPNVLKSFYTSKDLSDAAAKVGWNALTKYVNLPPELTQVMNAFGGDPANIAKMFSSGRAGIAFGSLAASQLFTLTKDAGISLAAGDFIAAQFGPSVSDMKALTAQATIEVAAEKQAIESTDITKTPGWDKLTPLEQAAARKGSEDSIKDFEANCLPTVQQRAQADADAKKQQATTSFEYAMLDYGATLSIRAASGSKTITMNGMAKTFLDPNSTTTDQGMFLLRTLSAFTPGELGQYIGDATAGYQIFNYLQAVNSANGGNLDNINYVGDNSGFAGNATGVASTTSKLPSIPTAAFNVIDSQLGKILGTSVPPGLSQGLFSLAATGSADTKFGGLVSFKDFLSSNAGVFFVGSWLDKESGLPSGTTYQLYQAGQNIIAAQQAVVVGAQEATMALSNASGAIAGADLGTTLAQAYAVQQGVAVADQAAVAAVNAAKNGAKVSSDVAAVNPATARLSAAVSAAVILVVNLAFSQTFSKMDQSLGLPPGTVSTLVGVGISLGIGMGVFGLTAIAALGGPLGLALLGAGLLAGFIFSGGKAKQPPVTKQFTRTFYSASGVAPGYESAGVGSITTSQSQVASSSSGTATTSTPIALTKLTDVPAQYITQAQAISAYQNAPTPVANQTLQTSKGSVPFMVTDSSGKPLSGSVAVVNPKASTTISDPSSKPLTTDQVNQLNSVDAAKLSLEQTGSVQSGNITSLNDAQKQVLATAQTLTIPVDKTGKVLLPVIQQDEKKDISFNLTFKLNGISSDPTATYDGTKVGQTGGTAISVTALTNTDQAAAATPTTLNVTAYDGGTVVLVGPTLGALATVKTYTPGANSPATASTTSTDGATTNTTLLLPKSGLQPASGAKIFDSTKDALVYSLDVMPIVQNNELQTQKFTNPMNPVSLPLSPAAFEANTQQQLQAQLPTVAQFEVSKFIGSLLYMPDIVKGGNKNITDSPTESDWEATCTDQTNVACRPSRIQSYGVSNRFLGTLTVPRYETQLNRLYGNQASSGQYRDVTVGNTIFGLGANDYYTSAVEVSW